jgi:arylsulfatase A
MPGRISTSAVLMALLSFSLLQARSPSSGNTPNILLLLADDLGLECVGAYGGKSYKTPEIDRLAIEGMRFTHCFSNPLCSPSRAQLLTGRYPLHNGIRRVIYDARRHREFLDPRRETSFANLLQDAGYATAMAGKWQVSFLFERDTVRDFGFDEYQCWKIQNPDYSRNLRYANPVFVRNGKTLRHEIEGRYGPDVNVDFLTDFMRRNRDRPFLVYHAMLLPHFPWEPTPDSGVPLQGVPGMGKGDPKYFPDMVSYLDKLVGRMVRAVDELELGRRTLILFAADNGTQQPLVSRWGPESRIVHGGKGKLADTGTRVPLIARWTGHIAPGSVSDDLVDFSDFLPTFVELAGARLPEQRINGRSFLPRLLGTQGHPRAWVHVQNQDRRYVRSRKWILTNTGELRPVVNAGREAALPVDGPLTAEQKSVKERLTRALQEAAFETSLEKAPEPGLRVAGPATTTRVAVKGDQILLNGKPVKAIGLRCSNALISDATVEDLIESLDLYCSYGVNTVSVYLMGSRFGDVKGYLHDGSLNPVYRDRLERVLKATDKREMIALVGCLYWSTSRAREDLSAWTQKHAERAVRETARWLAEKRFTHVILDPDNEGMAVRANDWRIASLIKAAKAAYPALVVANNTHQQPPNEDLNIHFGKPEEGKPWFDSEATPGRTPGGYWGRFSKETHKKKMGYYNYSRIGRYTTGMKADQLRQTAEEIERFNGYVLASTWLQCGPAEGIGGPFTDPGGRSRLGSGEDEDAAWNRDIDTVHPDAGILWWLEFVRQRYGPESPGR